MTPGTGASLSRDQINEVMDRHKGEKAAIARQLGVRHVTITTVLKGRSTSARVFDALQKRALELLAEEARNAA